jgi:hypothetical protein
MDYSEKNYNLEMELRRVLNSFCQENESNTPDWILAVYVLDCLDAFNRAVNDRERYYGRGNFSLAAIVDSDIVSKDDPKHD